MDEGHLQPGLRSCIKVPLISLSQAPSSMTLGSRRVGGPGPREQAILEKPASQIAPAIDNAGPNFPLERTFEE